MKQLLMPALLFVISCEPISVRYDMARNRTSKVVRNATLDAKFDGRNSVDFTMQSRAAFQGDSTNHHTITLPKELLFPDFFTVLKKNKVWRNKSGLTFTYMGPHGTCDLVRLKGLTDTASSKDVLLQLVVCESQKSIPYIDLSITTSSGFRVVIGFDAQI